MIDKELSNFISSNEDLLKHINKIKTYNDILNSEFSFLFFASLISSDTNIDLESINKHLKTVNFILSNLNYMLLTKSKKRKLKKHLVDSIKILKRDKNDLLSIKC